MPVFQKKSSFHKKNQTPTFTFRWASWPPQLQALAKEHQKTGPLPLPRYPRYPGSPNSMEMDVICFTTWDNTHGDWDTVWIRRAVRRVLTMKMTGTEMLQKSAWYHFFDFRIIWRPFVQTFAGCWTLSFSPMHWVSQHLMASADRSNACGFASPICRRCWCLRKRLAGVTNHVTRVGHA